MIFGQPNAAQLEELMKENTKVIARQTAQSKTSPAMLLQNAVKALGTAQGDPKLSKLKVDGVIGPQTLQALNYALGTYLKRSPVSLVEARAGAADLAEAVTQYVQAHGGVVPPVHRAEHKVSFTTPAAAAMIPLPAAEPERKWIWYAVGGAGLLLVLTAAAGAARKRRAAAAAA